MKWYAFAYYFIKIVGNYIIKPNTMIKYLATNLKQTKVN